MKRCSRCSLEKSRSEFYRNRSTRDGLQAYCKECVNAANRVAAPKYKEQFSNYQRRRHVMRKFGLTWEDYLSLDQFQGGLCAGCGKEEKITTRGTKPCSLAVDHDHETGMVRGLLCFSCNTAIGALNHDATLLRKLADYLERPAMIQTVSQKDRASISLSKPKKEYRLSAETKTKIAAAHLGKKRGPWTAEHRAHVMAARARRAQEI